MRVAVVGSSGSGKSTLAKRLAATLGLPHIELDAINWQAGWKDLNSHDPDEFVRRVSEAVGQNAWVSDGNYGKVRDIVWSRATHLVWLDYERSVIMPRVIRRSVLRALDRTELWPGTGNREDWRMWLSKDHPIRWAWDTWARRRAEYGARIMDPRFAHLQVHRLRHPREAEGLAGRLTQSVIPVCEARPGPMNTG
jgi:adenylate kinase family enzyme